MMRDLGDYETVQGLEEAGVRKRGEKQRTMKRRKGQIM